MYMLFLYVLLCRLFFRKDSILAMRKCVCLECGSSAQLPRNLCALETKFGLVSIHTLQ